MKQKRFKLLFVVLIVFRMTGIQAQNSISTSGKTATGTGGSVDYSIGQVINMTNTGTNGSVSTGVQQPYEIYIVNGLEQTDVTLQIVVYPNPVIDQLTLKIKNNKPSIFSIQLYQADGKLIKSKKMTENKIVMDVHELIPSTYLLKVIKSGKEIKIFKIIKK